MNRQYPPLDGAVLNELGVEQAEPQIFFFTAPVAPLQQYTL